MAGIIDPGKYFDTTSLKKKLKDTYKDLTDVNNKLNDLINVTKKSNESIKTQAATQSNTNKAIKDYNKNIDILTRTEKEQLKLREQTNQLIAKARAERQEETKQLVRAKIARQEQNKKIQETIRLEKTEEGSIARLTAQNKLLIRERNSLNPVLEKNQKRIKEINSLIDRNNNVIKSNSSALEKQKANVGNYQSALQGLPGPLGQASSGIGRMGQAFKILLANPIVLIIAGIVGAITGLVKALKRSEEGSNRLNKIMAGLHAGLNVVLDIFTRLAVNIVDAFKNPQQAIKDLWEIIKQYIVNRVTGMIDLFVGLKDVSVNTFKLIGASIKGIFKDNEKEIDQYKKNIAEASKDVAKAAFQAVTGVEAEKAKDFFKEVAKEIKNEAIAAANLQEKMDNLVKRERQFIVERERLNAQIARARELAQDENIPIEERRKLIEEAIKANEKLYSTEVSFANERARIVAAQVALGESSRDELTQVEELRAEAFRKERARAEGRKSLLRDQRRVENEFEKERREAQKIILEQELLNEKKKLLGFTGTQEEKAKAFENFATKVLEIQIQLGLDELQNAELTAEEKLRIENQLIDNQIALENKLTEKTKEEENKRKEFAEQRRDALIEIGNSIFEFNSALNERELARIDEVEANKLELVGDNEQAQERIKAQAEAKRKQVQRKQAISDKAQALFNAGINTARAVTAALALGPPQGIILGVLMGVLGAIQIATIAAKPIPKFAKGTGKDGLGRGMVAEFGERGREIIMEPNSMPYIAEKPTIDYLPKGTKIYSNPDTEKILTKGGVTPDHFNELIKEVRNNKPTIINKSTTITERGFEHEIRKGNTRIRLMNKYLGR